MSLQQINTVVEAVRNNGGYIIDDDAPTLAAFKPSCLGILKTTEGEHVVPIFHAWRFPITPVYIGKDNKPHMRKVDKRICSTEGIQAFDLAGHEADIKLVFEN